MPTQQLYIGDYRLQAAGKAQLSAGGECFTVCATALDGQLALRGEGCVSVQSGCTVLTLSNDEPTGGLVTLQGGLTGTVNLGVGAPELGARVSLQPGELSLAIGPPGVGALIKMTPVSIIFQVAETSYEMTPTGIVERTAATERQLSPIGHTLTAAETELSIAVQGVNYSAPMLQATAEAAAETEETIGTHATDAINQTQNGMLMLT